MAIDRTFQFGEDHLTASIALGMAHGTIKGILTDECLKNVNASYQRVQRIVEKGDTVYGINTGFGPLCSTRISKADTKILQSNILKSHSVGVGEPISTELAKIMLILKIHALAKGFSGIAETTLRRMLWHLENDAIPVVPSQGSVGASGDLAPLSHLFLPLIGLGKVEYEGKTIPTKELFEQNGLQPLELGPKEGLALINGTQFIAAHGVMVVHKLQYCLRHADIIGAMMLEGLQGSMKPFYEELHELRPFKGNQHVAGRIRTLLQGSEILEDHIDCERVQDPYSLRCMPQVHGASRNAWLH
ncbi:MAG TPA: histidine ammonia-lyase, partial [Muricauda sp.]|nr:histidine ammonia-lyase [Allomuricauda sp.]